MESTPRYIANDIVPLWTVDDPLQQVRYSLEQMVAQSPPKDRYLVDDLSGLWRGPTGFAYLFLHVSIRYPTLTIAGHHALAWAERYMAGARGRMLMDSCRCGIASEALAYHAVQACITKDRLYVDKFVANVPQIVHGKEFPNELLFGRAGTLYLLRIMRHWLPASAPTIDESLKSVTEAILSDGPDWKLNGRQYLGAIHGVIGIVTQLVLSTPLIAQEVEPTVLQLLDRQLPNGNWSASAEREDSSLVQLCHGAPGFLHSLVAIRPHFPNLHQRLDVAIEKAQQCVWKEGILRKQPSICHGLFGNAL